MHDDELIDAEDRAKFNGARNSDPLIVIDALDLDALDLPEPSYVVEHLLPRGALVLLSGDTGSGKSALMLHASVAIALGCSVGAAFAVMPDPGPVLYLNGELEPGLFRVTLRAAAAGFGARIADLRRGSVVFQGEHGMATLRFRADHSDVDDRRRFEEALRDLRPALVVFDTQRQLFDLDEKEMIEVRSEFGWLKRLAVDYGCCIVVVHHQRKIGQASNSERERVSGSRDLIAAADVHLALKSASSLPATALLIDKTRYPKDEVRAGVEFPVDAIFEPPSDGSPGRSTFAIGTVRVGDAALTTETAAMRDMLARFVVEPLLTRNDVGAGNNGTGSGKRAWADLVKRGRIVLSGQKKGRSELWKRSDAADELFSQRGPERGPSEGPP